MRSEEMTVKKRTRCEIRRTRRVLRRRRSHRKHGVSKRPERESHPGRKHVPVRVSSGRVALDVVVQRGYDRRRDSKLGARVFDEA